MRLQREAQTEGLSGIISSHRPNYVLPLTYSFDPNNQPAEAIGGDKEYAFDNVEVKFQISLKARAVDNLFGNNGDLYFAYTQQSLWQAYDSEHSSPFRDTNYEPEMFVAFDTDFEVLGLRNRMISLGAVHQSNGRGNEEISRSWNRIYAAFTLDRGDFAMQVRPWYRIPEDEEEDNNPDIEDYIGYGDLKMAYNYRKVEFATILRNNLQTDENRGSVQVDFIFPLNREIRGYVQYFNGYCETLLDYDHKDERIGIGFMLGDWL